MWQKHGVALESAEHFHGCFARGRPAGASSEVPAGKIFQKHIISPEFLTFSVVGQWDWWA